MTLLFAFLIGLFAGLRSLTPPAAVAWAVHLGWLKLARPLSLIGSLPAVIILSLLALTELILDKLPNTPNRTAPPGLIARIVTGGFTGACVSLGRRLVKTQKCHPQIPQMTPIRFRKAGAAFVKEICAICVICG
jgi:uncharacterized membrane protein